MHVTVNETVLTLWISVSLRICTYTSGKLYLFLSVSEISVRISRCSRTQLHTSSRITFTEAGTLPSRG